MYKILLAEDEPEVLNAMTRIIKWQDHGFEPPVPCRDGNEAIQVLKGGFAPDVLVTDICMPFVDGLELTEYINENLPNVVVVVLTGYDDFKYAQKAIKLKVYDYVLKPITPTQLNELMDRLKNELDARRVHSIDNSLKIMGSYFLNRLITKRLDAAGIEENCRANKLQFEGRYHLSAVLDVDLPTPSTVDESNNLELMRYGLQNIAIELAESSPRTLLFQGYDGLTHAILGEDDRDALYERATALMRHISAVVHDNLQVTVSAGIGEPVAYLDELYLSHTQASAALGYHFFYGESSIICAADIDIKKTGEIDYSSCERAFGEAVRALDRDGAEGIVRSMTALLKEAHVPFDRCVLYCQKLTMTLINLTDQVVGEREVRELEKSWEQSNFYAVSTLSQLEEHVLCVCAQAFSMFEVVKSDAAASQVMKAEKYIREHYGEPSLSLNTITEHLFISTSYFSAIFKAKTGSTFVEYLTGVRMEKAKQILAFSDRRTYETAEDVGFSDPHYFSVAFKRVTGMTPKEYREFSSRQSAAPGVGE